jgi:5'(3')-deoxyribonucleotidase
MRVYLDIDGVLADFTMGVHRKLGIDLDYSCWPYKKGPAGWDWNEELGMTFQQMNNICDYGLWVNLPWTPDGHDILRTVLSFTKDIVLLTTPMPNEESSAGKIAWVRENLPSYERHMLICPGRKDKTGLPLVPNSVLIDDNLSNVYRWECAGGSSILVPRWWNHLYPQAHDAPEHIRHKLTGYAL